MVPWSKAGLIITAGSGQGSAYAAVMVTGGHGPQMQWNYTGDTPGLAGGVSAASPRWLRLTRSGDVITGYDSADGTNWTAIGTVTLRGLAPTVQAGLFVTSPGQPEATNSGVSGASASGRSPPTRPPPSTVSRCAAAGPAAPGQAPPSTAAPTPRI